MHQRRQRTAPGGPAAPEMERDRMVSAQERSGEVTDPAVLAAMRAVPREAYVPTALRSEAYHERALPIGHDQTISQPLIVAVMTQALQLRTGDRVLEVGTGSGYQAAVLRHLVGHVVTVERIAELVELARSNLVAQGVDGVEVHCGDGTLGWPDGAPYDGIVVTAGGPQVPAALLSQLARGGRLVMPLGPRGDERLVRVTVHGGVQQREDLGAVAFVPLVGDQGWTAPPA